MRVIDSHTEGEPTRLVFDGGPDLGSGTMAERRDNFAANFDDVRRATILEPRGHAAMVGALLCRPVDPTNAAGLIFFNNEGFLGMCGHGAIGAAVSLHRLGRLAIGRHRFETPVGTVDIDLHDAMTATIENVPSYRTHKDVAVKVQGYGTMTGDIAWGGNWFFLGHAAPCAITPANIPQLTAAAHMVRASLDDPSVDHIEFFEPSSELGVNSRSFVLCPGGQYDRSPCGTGTSAKLACLAADGVLAECEDWVQESVIGGRFTARYRKGAGGAIIPAITGRAFVTARAELFFDGDDPFRNGL